MNLKPLFDTIVVDYNQEEIWDKVQEVKSDFLDHGWEEEFEDIDEAYAEIGRGEAENQVINELIGEVTHEYPITDSAHSELYEKLAEHYELETD